MYVPRQCTQNSQSHVDYGIPLLAKVSDFRTSYTRSHDAIPNVPQEFDCRVNNKINADLFQSDVTLRNDAISTNKRDYTVKFSDEDVLVNYQRASNNRQVHGIRNLQESLSKLSPPSIRSHLSEMKDNYKGYPYKMNLREEIPPAISSICDISGIGRSIQPPIPPNEVGAWKYLDNYMTTNKLQLIPYNENQVNDARTDFPTFYNTSGVYAKSSKCLPGPLTGNQSVYDKTLFKYQFPIKNLKTGQKRVPHSGIETEYQGKYVSQTYSDMYPYTTDSGQKCASLESEAGPWQNLCPPGMYFTEYSHIGSAWPIRAVVSSGETRKFRYSSQQCEKNYCK